MTPAKLLALKEDRLRTLELEELPIAALRAQHFNMNRDPGDPKANPPRASTPPRELIEFQIFGNRKQKPLAAKVQVGGDHNLMGAKANKNDWIAYVQGKNPDKVVVRKRK